MAGVFAIVCLTRSIVCLALLRTHKRTAQQPKSHGSTNRVRPRFYYIFLYAVK
ncbi:hypothetical protein TSAR_009227 [Trichomalopsis sarcophagae]|uniref:Uncharacterized protein n=1 Tax=Trichomalopsis sarcophagae TaxID=543379 RepID=A0A232EZ73_9HYME|nr:hypothetical protein TSAR_009227 [Trichomalopsis sarcophagae]